jgi:hypothetical protein
MKNEQYIGVWIRRFLLEHVVRAKNISRNTQLSYRDTIRLLMAFTVKELRKLADKIHVEELTPVIIKAFFDKFTNRQEQLFIYLQSKALCHTCFGQIHRKQ